MPESPHQPPARRQFQFRLRTFLIAIAVLAVLTAWVGNSLKWIAARHTMILEHANYADMLDQPRTTAPGGLWLFGETGKVILDVEPGYGEEARRLFPEAKVSEADR